MKRCGRGGRGRLVPVLVLALAATAACVATGKEDPSLAYACQLEACECLPKTLASLGDDPQPVLWAEDGKAYCPDGHSLSRGGKSDFVKRYGG